MTLPNSTMLLCHPFHHPDEIRHVFENTAMHHLLRSYMVEEQQCQISRSEGLGGTIATVVHLVLAKSTLHNARSECTQLDLVDSTCGTWTFQSIKFDKCELHESVIS
jgi:hypothetical protein